MDTFPKLYREDPDHQMKRVFLPDAAYANAIETFIIVCTDVVIIDRTRKTFWLVKRCVKPMAGLWIIGGRRQAGEGASKSIQRCFKRETSLDLPESRFEFVTISEYHWKDRAQEPQDAGSHNLSYIFITELTDPELRTVTQALEKDEYEKGFGLQEFDRPQMANASAHPFILDLYDKIFAESR